MVPWAGDSSEKAYSPLPPSPVRRIWPRGGTLTVAGEIEAPAPMAMVAVAVAPSSSLTVSSSVAPANAPAV